MQKFNDFVEIESGYFIEYHKYQTLLDIGVLPWEMRAYITREASSYRAVSSVGKPLAFQKKFYEQVDCTVLRNTKSEKGGNR